MNPLKKSLTINEFLDTLLEQRMLIDKALKEQVKGKDNFSGEENLLNLETKIFSLWLISLTIKERELKEFFHQRFCDAVGLDRLQVKMFYDQIKIRYDNYNYANNSWIGNHHKGYLLGSVMTEIIVNQNPNFSIQETRPMTDWDINLEMFTFYGVWFDNTLNLLIKLKENYILPTLN